ncbi:filamentous hemagglutinin N-terminal domain-containing protein [Bordetella petrii]|nr:filamentous hemagglutinin N-terminal domain-containing protein [Bordetella petrii]
MSFASPSPRPSGSTLAFAQGRGGLLSRHVRRLPRLTPLASALAVLAVVGSVAGPYAHAQPRPFSGGWMAAKGATQSHTAATGRLPNGMLAGAGSAARQQQQARATLNRSVQNLGSAAAAIAAQQAAQAAARAAAAHEPSVPDGLAEGGLKVDVDPLTAGWLNAKAPVQTRAGGRTTVAIEQTADKAILNWETFNVGRNTTVDFRQQSDWAVLNRVNDPQARPSQIQGQIKADGTVMIANRNGVVFTGSSQVNVRNLVAAAAKITDAQFRERGIFGADDNTATFVGALGKVTVEQGAQLQTHEPASVTQGGGYVMLLGQEVRNDGHIVTRKGQAQLAAGDSFVIRKGLVTNSSAGGTTYSTTRGNEVAPKADPGLDASLIDPSLHRGRVTNAGLIQAREGDVTLAGHDVRQQGVAMATTTVNTRGTIHLLNSASDTQGTIALGKGAITAIILEDDGQTAFDSQRQALIEESAALDALRRGAGSGAFDNLSTQADRRDQSRIEIVSGRQVDFAEGSLTLATGGQVAVSAGGKAVVREGATLDVSGAVGVQVAMASNNVQINIQGNEQRDAPGNRDSTNLNNSNVWVDRRSLVLVPAGTGGYETDRWYTAGGLLEVGGYLGTTGHSVGEWMAQGGTVDFTGGEVATGAGSSINLSGGTLDVQSGYIRRSWLRGSDGRLYTVDRAPGDLLYQEGLYQGYERQSVRWGRTDTWINPLVAPGRRWEEGYTVGRDAGRLIIGTQRAVLEGDLETDTFQGGRQHTAPAAGLDGYRQVQDAVARRGALIIGTLASVYDEPTRNLRYSPVAVVDEIVIGMPSRADEATQEAAADTGPTRIVLDSAWLNGLELGSLQAYAKGSAQVSQTIEIAHGGEIALHAAQVDVNADVVARGGAITLGNMVEQYIDAGTGWQARPLTTSVPTGYEARVAIGENVTLDARGLWNNLWQDGADRGDLPFVDGGIVRVRSSGDVQVAAGSLLDVSSGAALMAGGGLRGGQGGDITLAADAYSGAGGNKGRLELAGELRGHGVDGGGTLRLQTGNAVVIGGQVPGSDGVLQAGDTPLVDLIATESFTLAQGAVLPVDYHFTRTHANPGEAVGGAPRVVAADPASWLTLGAAWTLPKAAGEYVNYSVTLSNGQYLNVDGYSWSTPPTLPAGTVITSIVNPANFPANYVVDSAILPNGIPLAPTPGVLKAGTVAASDLTYAAGTLIRAGAVLPQAVAVEALLHLDAGRFQQGFARYDVTGGNGLAVAKDADLRVTMPVLQADLSVAHTVATGADPRSALAPWLSPQFVESAQGSRMTQRGGADLVLTAGTARSMVEAGETPTLAIGEGARVEVDPGHAIVLNGNGQINIDGELRAPAGRIGVYGLGYGIEDVGHLKGHDRSVWIGEKSVLDVAGVAATAVDAQGRRYGVVLDGGRIEIGGQYQAYATKAEAIDNFIVMRPGARLDASGAAATLDLAGEGATRVASDGGVIHLASFNGLYLDGDMQAAAGGAGAAGGTLSLALEAPAYRNAGGPADRVLAHRELQLVQQQKPEGLSADLRAGQADPGLVYGHGRIGVDRIEAGGFDNLSLLVNGVLALGDGVDLSLGQSLHLASGGISLAEGAPVGARVKLAAPYVRLAGPSRVGKDNYTTPSLKAPSTNEGGMVQLQDDTQLRVEAGMLDVLNQVAFGAYGFSIQGDKALVSRPGFAQLELRSRNDLRLLKHTVSDRTSLTTEGDLLLAASQIYPATGATAEVRAGRKGAFNQWGVYEVSYDPERVLRLERSGDGATPPTPYSAFGVLRLLSANIDQGGVLRAPLGILEIGVAATDSQEPGAIRLRPGSVTSVSAAGLVMPYGGTVDGLSYNYAGAEARFHGLGASLGNVTLTADNIEVQDGARIDLSGGGDLTGAGFLTGRGGSTDARLNPLIQADPLGHGFTLPGLSTNPVYAIVPGAQPVAAPVAAENGAGDPLIGHQITIAAGVPGLAAGTYTLMPSTYALLPGAFRVELNGLASGGAAFGGAVTMRNGSYATAARLGITGTGIADVQTTQAVLTSADTLRRYSQYNETSYAQFGLDWALRDSAPRPQLERDARQLVLAPGSRLDIAAGSADFTPAQGGRGGTVVLNGGRIEILADGAAPTEGFDGTSVHAGTLNGLGAAGISIGGSPASEFAVQNDSGSSTQNAWQVSLGNGSTAELILRQGAVLEAASVFLVVNDNTSGLTIEQGAGINTLGQGKAPWDWTDGYVLRPGQTGVLAVSNGWLNVTSPTADDSWGPRGAGYLNIGTCAAGATCAGETVLYSEGTITAATNKSFELGESVRYGTRNLVLAMGGINVGSAAALAQADAAGVLPAGLTLNQTVLDRLLRGDTRSGAPALENLVLNASDSVNFYGSVDLSTIDPATGRSALERLVLGTPAIYGHGGAGDLARIETDILVWNGATTPAASVIAGGAGTGSGRFVVDAKTIEFGYGPQSQPDTVATHKRLALGFANVDLNAGERITANHKGDLAVYQSQGAWDDTAKAWTYSGGNLNINTPMLTGQAGSVNAIKAGGAIAIAAPAGVVVPPAEPATLAEALGAELALDAGTHLVLDTAVLLPSGKLTLSAQDDVRLAAGAQLDLAGRKIDFFDVGKYSWGGDVMLSSRHGNVVQHAASTIDLGAEYNRAGKLTALALEGMADLAGAIVGVSTGHYDAGGTQVPFAAGYLDVRAQRIADFAGLNERLTQGGVFGGRSFQLKQGDLVIGNELKAREINVSVDNGSLRVTGRVDASGEQAGSIRLAANNGVTIASSAVLDASASVLRRDSYGQAIEAPNRAVIEIDSGGGRLVLADGARMELDVAGASADYGTVALNAPRLGGATGNDVDIDASGNIAIAGAKSIAVNAFYTYDDASPGTDTSVDGRSYQRIDQAYLDEKHGDSVAFIGNALANGTLMNRKLAGLRRYTGQFHLRPGVEVVSNAALNPDGDLHVDGDIDLSGHRYASVNPHTARTSIYGSGEAGALVLRAASNLTFFGSITDGFDTSKLGVTADDNGWVLPAGRMPFGGDLVIPHGAMATLDAGTKFAAGRTLNYDVPVAGVTLPAGTLLPATMPLAQPLALPAGTVLGAAVLDADGNVAHAAGTVLQAPLTLDPGMQLAAGFRLPVQAHIAATVWPKGVALPAVMTLSQPLTLAKGAVVPSETDVVLPGGAQMVNLRPTGTDGTQGRTLALAPMLAPGSQSWDIRLVAGADLQAADSRLTQVNTTARLRLADPHFGLGAVITEVPGSGGGPSYVWGDLSQYQTLMDMMGLGELLTFTPVSGEPVTQAQIDELMKWGMIGSSPDELNGFDMGEMVGVVQPGFVWGDLSQYQAFADMMGLTDLLTFTPVSGEPVTQVQIDELMMWGLIGSSPDELNDFGMGEMVSGSAGGPPETVTSYQPARQQLFSVLRTGTGDLDLISGGDVEMTSLYGVYTAGTPSASLGSTYNQSRGRLTDGTVLRPEGAPFEGLVDGGPDSLYAAWYPEQGGNVLVRAQGDLKGDLVGNNEGKGDVGYTFANTRQQIASTAVGNWLWRQGIGSVEAGANALPTAWWINFGTYVAGGANGTRDEYGTWLFGNDPFLVGFTGVGTLGGGNLTVEAGGNAGMIDARGIQATWNETRHTPRSQGLHLAVASTGRITPDGVLMQTGGGDLALRLGGSLNPDPALRVNEHDLNSTFVNLRGATAIDAAAIGGVKLGYGGMDQMDSRLGNVYAAGGGQATGGPILVLGDSAVRIETRGDLVLGGTADPGRTLLLNATPFSYQGTAHDGDGWTWFSLWTPATAIDLFSAGGNLTPTTTWDERDLNETVRGGGKGRNQSANGDGSFYPSVLRAAAANGSLYYGASASNARHAGVGIMRYAHGTVLAPAPVGAQFVNATGQGELQLLAQDSIQGAGYVFSTSAADPRGMTSPFRPGFVGKLAETGGGQYGTDPLLVHNAAADAAQFNDWLASNGTLGRGNTAALFTFGGPATVADAVVGREPSRYYAVQGDIVGLRVGQEVLLGFPAGAAGSRYEASGPVAIRAGRDIVGSGTPLGKKDPTAGRLSSTDTTRGNLIAHAYADEISVVQAGRDLRDSSFYILGPGLLDISAGRHVYLANNGEFKSLGPVGNVAASSGDRSGGASISVAVGVGEGAYWDAFAQRYLNPANLADPDLPLADQPGKAVISYGGELTLAQWLRREFGYAGDESGAPAFLAHKQAELDAARATTLADGRTGSGRSLAREFQQESQLYLVNWLSGRFAGPNGLGLSFDAATMDARAFFDALPPEQQRAYLRNVYYAELRESGREYNDPDGKRLGSYLRGREAIATLFPEQDAQGRALTYEGDLTMFSSALYFTADYANNPVGQARPRPGVTYVTKAQWEALGRPGYGVSFYDVLDAGIHTKVGGDISIMTPGGRTLVGIDGGFNPGPGSGVITQGDGNINLYALDSILLGQSRIFTTFGGSILAWSAQGDINAGRGSKTTMVYTPQRREYDIMGNVALSPSAPSTGAGIATLNPIPEVPPGDIDLIAPLGTIDAGEAGIRVSGNVNVAALHVVNADNIQVQGESTGIPVMAAVNVGALTSASAAASSAATAAQESVSRARGQARDNQPSVFTVRILGFGGQGATGGAAGGSAAGGSVAGNRRAGYRPDGMVQVVGEAALTAAERRRFGL